MVVEEVELVAIENIQEQLLGSLYCISFKRCCTRWNSYYSYSNPLYNYSGWRWIRKSAPRCSRWQCADSTFSTITSTGGGGRSSSYSWSSNPPVGGPKSGGSGGGGGRANSSWYCGGAGNYILPRNCWSPAQGHLQVEYRLQVVVVRWCMEVQEQLEQNADPGAKSWWCRWNFKY